MPAFLSLILFILGRIGAGPGPDSLPYATVLLDREQHQLVIELPAVEVPAAAPGGGGARRWWGCRCASCWFR